MPEFKPRVVLKPRSRGEMPISEEKLTTGEPDAGDPQVRFGGGAASKTVIPPPIDFSTLNIDNPG